MIEVGGPVSIIGEIVRPVTDIHVVADVIGAVDIVCSVDVVRRVPVDQVVIGIAVYGAGSIIRRVLSKVARCISVLESGVPLSPSLTLQSSSSLKSRMAAGAW